MAPTVFATAESERASIRDHLDYLETEVQRHAGTPLTLAEVEAYLVQLDETRTLITTNHQKLRLHAPASTDMAPIVTEYRTILSLASRVFAGLANIKMTFPVTSAVPTSSATSTQRHIKLPALELPKFSGNLQEWVSFRDLFVTAVHNSSLSKVEKFTQLKGHLTGEAARQVRSLLLSETNYDIAWKQLTDRYENNRELLFSILKRLFNQPVITSASASGVRSLIDTTKECIRSLEVLLIPTQHWDSVLIYIIFNKLDNQSRELWEQTLPDTSIPKLDKLYEFLEQRARALAASTVTPSTRTQKPSYPPAKSHHATTNCKLGCGQSHPIYKCNIFHNKSPSHRLEDIKRLRLCINCLGEGHNAASCRSTYKCRNCNRRHHTMLHDDSTSSRQAPQPTNSNPINQVVSTPDPAGGSQSHHSNSNFKVATGILATALITIQSDHGGSNRRALIDGGSTNTQIMRKTARRLRLPLRSINIPMTGPGGVDCGTVRHVTTFSFNPHFNKNLVLSATALVVDKISGSIPSNHLQKDEWSHLQGLQYADPNFDQPSEVELLLGTDIVWSILQSGKVYGNPGQPLGIQTTLGWLIAGPNDVNPPISASTFNSIADLDTQLRRFWEQEEASETPKMTKEEEECESKFKDEHKRDAVSGRFTVSLPFKLAQPNLGSSRPQAVSRFLSLERKYTHPNRAREESPQCKLNQQWQMYKEFMSEYKILHHMEEVPSEEVHDPNTYYIPHHAVFKESSTTTKLRVVFDASAPTSNGISLNECMMTGPQLQDTIRDIMLRFRIHPIAFTADIAKMYRQINVAPPHTNFQRIVWRDSPMDPIKDYRLLTVTYGTTSAPYLAVKCLQQLAKDEATKYPVGSRVALQDFYVDDIASSCSTLEDAKTTVTQLIDLCVSGGFDLRKWTTNSTELLSIIPESIRETNSAVELQHDSTIKTLGVFWNPTDDIYFFKLSLPPDMPGKLTKRSILSEIAKIYDPLGWLAPAIIVCKIFMQELWKLKHDWDQIVPSTVADRWNEIRTSLFELQTIKIPRCVLPSSPKKLLLIGCSDASTKAISASVYIAAEYNNQSTSCHLLTSKTKVAPLKPVTLPRLELNGAVLLSELLSSTMTALNLDFDEVRAFTDSTITLHWIKSSPTKWKVYVRNRVQTIHDNISMAKWFHISGEHNPADCASRGITGIELKEHPLWWNGSPAFFNDDASTADIMDHEIPHLEREQSVKIHHAQPWELPWFLLKYSSFGKLQRIVAYIQRFIFNCRTKVDRIKGPQTVSEVQAAHTTILKLLQHTCYHLELEALSKGLQLPHNNPLLKLQPFVDDDGLLRVGGRLRHSNLSFCRKHPVLIPRNHLITDLIIQHFHRQNLHAGPTATLSILQRKYWILNARNTVRANIRKCVTCTRHRGETLKQLMGDLPPHRINQSRPFQKVGVDYAGPITIKPMVRSKITLKSWLCIFVCCATRAIHIEVVSSLSTDCFLAAFRRFIARRGKPSDMYSDCGTNFKGADKALVNLFISDVQKAATEEANGQEIRWHFNPPGAPHFGGLWEAGVKSIKHHLVRVMGATVLTYEEMHTLVTQIEGILNSRPLVPVSTDPLDLEALTPGHFLIGAPIAAAPEPKLDDIKLGHLQRWHLLQQQQQLFWKRWSSEYLTRLQQRPKWMKPSPNLQPGQMVLIKEDRAPPLQWKLARVLTVHAGKDGHVRVATVKTKDGEVKRPIVKLSLLPIS